MSVGKERLIKIWSEVKPEKEAPVTRTTLRTTGPVPADSRAIGTQLCDPINSGLTRWRLMVYIYVDAVAESGTDPASKHQTQPECGE